MKFNPENFGFKIANDYDDCTVYCVLWVEGKTLFINQCAPTLNYYKGEDSWIILMEAEALQKHLPPKLQAENVTLFVGKIDTDEDFKWIMDKIIIDPAVIVKLN